MKKRQLEPAEILTNIFNDIQVLMGITGKYDDNFTTKYRWALEDISKDTLKEIVEKYGAMYDYDKNNISVELEAGIFKASIDELYFIKFQKTSKPRINRPKVNRAKNIQETLLNLVNMSDVNFDFALYLYHLADSLSNEKLNKVKEYYVDNDAIRFMRSEIKIAIDVNSFKALYNHIKSGEYQLMDEQFNYIIKQREKCSK